MNTPDTTKATPGPWRFDPEWALIIGPNDEEIAACHAAQSKDERRTSRAVCQANAALIASAPALLADNQRLREALLVAEAELVTLEARLSEPYRRNVAAACKTIQAALSAVERSAKV